MNEIEKTKEDLLRFLRIGLKLKAKVEIKAENVQVLHDALEKQIKQKADIDNIGRYICPACLIPIDNGRTARGLYCKWCGQRFRVEE